MIQSIVTVCTGNICRSPVAEAVLRQNLPQCTVTSAGLHALVGHDIDESSRAAAEASGVPTSHHEARQFTDKIGADADLILVMDQGHLQKIRHKFPQLTGKCFLLRHHCAQKDVPDPYKMGIANHYRAVELIIEGAAIWVQHIKELE